LDAMRLDRDSRLELPLLPAKRDAACPARANPRDVDCEPVSPHRFDEVAQLVEADLALEGDRSPFVCELHLQVVAAPEQVGGRALHRRRLPERGWRTCAV